MAEFFGSTFFPPLLVQFVISALLSFIVGLELHSYRRTNQQDLGFGTSRTFTLIGIAGFVLYVIDEKMLVYICGLTGLIVFLGIYYYHRSKQGLYSLIGPLLAVLTYLIAAVIIRFPDWFAILYVVAMLLMLGEMPGIRRFSDSFRSSEMITFSKFLIMAGVVLPLLPDRQIAPFVTVTYYQVWLALLVVSSVSYLSYLAQTYLFKDKGILLTGMLGGLYSSTATTIVLGRQSRKFSSSPQITQAIILATAMMYFRLLLLIFFLGHIDEALQLLSPFVAFLVASLLAIWAASYIPKSARLAAPDLPLSNPLEFKTALIFSILFVLFAALTSFVIDEFGTQGLQALSFLVGLTDIDPFILSLLGGNFQISQMQLIVAVVIASGSNNLLKAAYAFALGRDRYTLAAAVWLIFLFVVSMIYVYWLQDW